MRTVKSGTLFSTSHDVTINANFYINAQIILKVTNAFSMPKTNF